jgi:O-antigen/teichoic acid export membrane protein
MAFLGAGVFRVRGQAAPKSAVVEGFRLAGWAFAAYAAFTALQSLDLLWVNRNFTPEASGAYAAAVLLRRILILLPGAAAVVMYPRIVARVVGGEAPDRLLGLTLAIVVLPVAALAALYAVAGPAVVAFVFGPGYETAGPLLGVMGVAMLGFGIASIWLNVFLATRPAVFVILLGAAALLEALGLAVWHADLAQIAAVFAAGGWLPAIGGAAIYQFSLRPALRAKTPG